MGQCTAFIAALSLALVSGALPADPGARAEGHAAYLTAIADLPLLPGLAEVPEAGWVFDQPSGRIIEAYAKGPVGRAAVRVLVAALRFLKLRRECSIDRVQLRLVGQPCRATKGGQRATV